VEHHLIVTVCKGNMHRSVVAESCINKVLKERGFSIDYEVISRGIQGTAAWKEEGMKPLEGRSLRDYPKENPGQSWERNMSSFIELGLDISEHASTPIILEDVERAALILVMDQKVLDSPEYGTASLVRQFPLHRPKMRLFLELEGAEEGIEDCGPDAEEAQYRSANEHIHRIVCERIETLLNWTARG